MTSTIFFGNSICIIYVLINIPDDYNFVWSSEMTKPAYMGVEWIFDYVVFSEHKTWLSAKDVCKSVNGDLQHKTWYNVNWYIKTKAERKGWSINDDVWLGMIKHQNSAKWYETRKGCPERNFLLPCQNFFERQCAVLNMSAVSHADTSNMFYASPCDRSDLGFICLLFFGTLPTDVQYYPKSEVLEKGFNTYQWNTSSETECAVNSFSIFYCYAATYYPEDKYCVAECTEMTTILDTVTLVNSSHNSTVLLRSHSKVIINHTLSSIPTSTGQYPCIPDTTRMTEPEKSTKGSIPETTRMTEPETSTKGSIPETTRMTEPETSTKGATPTTKSENGTSTLQQILGYTTTFTQPDSSATSGYYTAEKTTTTDQGNGLETVTHTQLHKSTKTGLQYTSTTTLSSEYRTTGDYFSCCCIDQKHQANMTTKLLKKKVTEIRRMLAVNVTSLSSTKRKKISAPDNRQSSVAMGTLGACLIVCVIMTLVLCDLFTFSHVILRKYSYKK